MPAAGPTSHVNTLPATTNSQTFTISWTGQDDTGGSGIASYDLYVSRNGSPFEPLLSTSLTSQDISLDPGYRYDFYTIATDNVGHREATPASAQTTILVLPKTWQNPFATMDVNDDGFVSPLDALLIINRLNTPADRNLPTPTATLRPIPYIDVSGDGIVSPLDVLLVINILNLRHNGGGEGEGDSSLLQFTRSTFAILAQPTAFISCVFYEKQEKLTERRHYESDVDSMLLAPVQTILHGPQPGVACASALFATENRLKVTEPTDNDDDWLNIGFDADLIELLAIGRC